MKITPAETAEILKSIDNIVILCHQNPDGDTLGSAFSLYYALKQLNKNVRVECQDKFPVKFSFLYKAYEEKEFEAHNYVAVDVASAGQLGDKYEQANEDILLCIDHHKSNTEYAKNLCLNSDTAAACEVMYEVLKEMNVDFNTLVSTCIYTGIATDSGCFKFSNTGVKTHIIAAEMIENKVNTAKINELLFDTKTKAQIKLEMLALSELKYYFDDTVAVIKITNEMLDKTKAVMEEIDGIASIPRMIEGVSIGVTIKEKEQNLCKISLRTDEKYDASKICAVLGGGGHSRAAGCTVNDNVENAEKIIIETINKFVKKD